MRLWTMAAIGLALVLPRASDAACGVSAQARPIIHASLANGAEPGLTITFLGHASFEIETPEHVTVVTDYNGVNIPETPPDVATMNHAHSTHYTDYPDPRIKHILRGWKVNGQIPDFDFHLGDLHITNLPTNIRGPGGSTEYYGNSIFVFESAGLCVAHLSHLHHLLTPDDIVQLGDIDVVMAPVDGIWTMSQEDMIQVLEQLHPRLVLPMHYFGPEILQRFLDKLRGRYEIRISDRKTVELTRSGLPDSPAVLVLPGGYY